METESLLHGCCSVTQLCPPGRTWGWESSAGGEAGGGRIRLRACGRAYPGETSVHSQSLAAPSQETAPEKPIWRRPPDTRRGPGPTGLRPSPARVSCNCSQSPPPETSPPQIGGPSGDVMPGTPSYALAAAAAAAALPACTALGPGHHPSPPVRAPQAPPRTPSAPPPGPARGAPFLSPTKPATPLVETDHALFTNRSRPFSTLRAFISLGHALIQ